MNTIHQLSVGRLLVNAPEGCGRVEIVYLFGTIPYITDKSGDVDWCECLPINQNWQLNGLCSEMSEEEIQECTALGYDPTTTYLVTDKTQVI